MKYLVYYCMLNSYEKGVFPLHNNVIDSTRNRWIALAMVLAMLFCAFAPIRSYADNEVPYGTFQSDVVYLINLNNGSVVFNKNGNAVKPMASLTKITTALVVMEQIGNLDRQVLVTQDELDEIKDPASASGGIKAGEILTVRQLMNIMMIKSANEAAIILAHEACGSTPAFVQEMNNYARSHGCYNTHYANPHGLTASNHYTTAADLARLCKLLLNNQTLAAIVRQPYYVLPETNLRSKPTKYVNPNKLLRSDTDYYYPGCRGIKTGFTNTSGRTFASTVTRNGKSYLCVVLAGHDSIKYENKYSIVFEDAINAYNWAFNGR